MFIHGDSRQVLDGLSIEVQTTIMDPPYNINFDYGGGYNDNLPPGVYLDLMEQIAGAVFARTIEGGSFFVIHYPVAMARLLPRFEKQGWKVHQWITWCYNTNTGHTRKKFTTASRVILWLSKGEPYYIHKATVQPYKNPNDKRIKERMKGGDMGASHYDYWNINLVKNCSKDHAGYFNQIPQELLRRLILHTSDPGDIILDPCCGSGSTVKAAFALDRLGLGIDISDKALELWQKEGLIDA